MIGDIEDLLSDLLAGQRSAARDVAIQLEIGPDLSPQEFVMMNELRAQLDRTCMLLEAMLGSDYAIDHEISA